MFVLTIHSGMLQDAHLHNMLARLEFGYETLDAVATYKAQLFQCGSDAGPVFFLSGYPRWATTLWDLVLRLLASGLYGDGKAGAAPQLPAMPTKPTQKAGAYARQMCMVLEHLRGTAAIERARIGSGSIVLESRKPGRSLFYRVDLQDDICGRRQTRNFEHACARLNHADLAARGICVSLYGGMTIPPAPELPPPPIVMAMPTPEELEADRPATSREDAPVPAEQPYVAVHSLSEPAASGFRRYLNARNIKPRRLKHGPEVVAQRTYMHFLSRGL